MWSSLEKEIHKLQPPAKASSPPPKRSLVKPKVSLKSHTKAELTHNFQFIASFNIRIRPLRVRKVQCNLLNLVTLSRL